MGNLKFDDIDEWTPSSISIVDEPSHPLCHFEVYENDEEYVKKSIEIEEGEIMVEEPKITEEPMVQAPVSFFEKLLGRTVGKAVEEVPEKPPEKPEEKAGSNLEERIAKLEEKVAKLEKANESEEKPPAKEEAEETTPGAVTKSEGEASEGETSEAATTEEIVNEDEVVIKSKSLDPDTITTSAESDKTLVERAGRNTNGMSW